MKLTLNFQTLILLTLTLVLALATAVWGAIIYNSTYDIILHGFDQKLTALSVGAGEFTDGDGHAEYGRPRQIRALTAGRDGQLWAFDGSRGGLVSIDPADGGALPLAPPRTTAVRSIAFDALQNRVVVLSGDGLAVHASLDQSSPLPSTLAVAQPVDELLFVDGVLIARRGRELTALEGNQPLLTLAEDVVLLSPAPSPASYVGLARSDSAVLLFDAAGQLLRRVQLKPATPEILGLAFVGDTLYAAADSLLRIDPESGEVTADFAPGYYSERDPWFERYRSLYIKTGALAGLTFLYTDVYLGENQIRYILDGSEGDDHSPPGTLDEVPPESIADVRLAQLTGQAFVSDIREWEEWGLIKVSAAPIYASDGRIVGLAGADVDISLIRNKTRFALFAVLFVGAALLLLAGSVSYRVSQGMTRPLRDIKDSALRIAAGYHGTRVAHESSDEIGQLAQSLNALSTRLAARARQSQTYQHALDSGREQVALQHAVGELLEFGTGHLPPGLTAGEMPEDSAMFGDGKLALLWRLASIDSETVVAQLQHVRLQRLAAALLASQNGSTALAMMYQTMPNIAHLACWDAAAGSVEIRCRAKLTLTRIDAAGRAQTLDVADATTIVLAPGERLDLPGAVTLQRPEPTQVASPS